MEHSALSPSQIQALTRIWEGSASAKKANQTWEADLKQVYELGLGMQELLQFLYHQQPDLTRFLQWANDNSHIPATSEATSADVLSAADLAHWEEHGYVVLRNAVTDEECAAANHAIWEFLGADPAEEASWYQPHPAKNGLMIVFTQHPALQAVRNSPRIRRAYEQLYGTTAIYKVIDKVSFNPPENSHYHFAGSPLHWDTSLELLIPERFQGLLYLNEVTAEGGAFQCVPGFHRSIRTWVESQPPSTDLRRHALNTLQPIPVPGNAGDFIIWHQALPHCASPNYSDQPRLVQYLTYLPDGFRDDRGWK